MWHNFPLFSYFPSGLGADSKYVVDFAPDLSEIITETKYMEQLGFSIPELARNVALQVKIVMIERLNSKHAMDVGFSSSRDGWKIIV